MVDDQRQGIGRAGVHFQVCAKVIGSLRPVFLVNVGKPQSESDRVLLFIAIYEQIGQFRAVFPVVPEILQEIIAVAKARDISLPEEALQTTMNMYDGLVSQSTASLQRDVMEGRPSELDAQIGAVVRFGQEADVATPQHTFIYCSLLPMELQARGQLQFGK